MAHETLKTLITNNIKTNGQNAITAQILQDVLIAMVDEYPDISSYATRTWVQQQGYITESALNGYATQLWVTTRLENYLPLTGGTLTGDLTVEGDVISYSGAFVFANEDVSHSLSIDRVDADLMYDDKILATQPWVTTQLDDYLPLSGGTLTGSLVLSSNEIKRGEIFGDEYGLNIQVSGQGKLLIENAIEANSTIKTEGFIKNGGTSDQVLCADGSVKTLSELKTALNAI